MTKRNKARGPRRKTETELLVDAHIGGKIRERRAALGYTQYGLAYALGLSHQQVQKYETGVNRVPISRLMEIARFLDVPLNYFLPEEDGAAPDLPHGGVKRPLIQLAQAFERLSEDEQRIIAKLVQVMADTRPSV